MIKYCFVLNISCFRNISSLNLIVIDVRKCICCFTCCNIDVEPTFTTNDNLGNCVWYTKSALYKLKVRIMTD